LAFRVATNAQRDHFLGNSIHSVQKTNFLNFTGQKHLLTAFTPSLLSEPELITDLLLEKLEAWRHSFFLTSSPMSFFSSEKAAAPKT